MTLLSRFRRSCRRPSTPPRPDAYRCAEQRSRVAALRCDRQHHQRRRERYRSRPRRRARGRRPRGRSCPGRPVGGRPGRRRRVARRGRPAARVHRRPARRERRSTSMRRSATASRAGCSTGCGSHPRDSPRWPRSSRCSPRHPEPPRQRGVRTLATGERVFERRVPVGVIGAVFEARPNVTVDVASQVLKARSAAVLRTGSAALAQCPRARRPRARPRARAARRAGRRRATRPDARPCRRRGAGRAAGAGAARRRPRERRGHAAALRARRGGRHPRARPRRRWRGALPRRAAPPRPTSSGWSPRAPTGSACATGSTCS